MTNWLDEKEAAHKLGYTNTVYFRRKVKKGEIPIRYTSPSGRKFQYEEKSIEKFLMLQSKIAA